MKYKLQELKINWNRKFANTPDLMCFYDELDNSTSVYKEFPIKSTLQSLYIADEGDCISFFSHYAYGTSAFERGGEGYGGRGFEIKLEKDGEIIDTVLKGPWSSGCYAVNHYLPEDMKALESCFTCEQEVWDIGGAFFQGGHLKKSVAEKYFKEHDDFKDIVIKSCDILSNKEYDRYAIWFNENEQKPAPGKSTGTEYIPKGK